MIYVLKDQITLNQLNNNKKRFERKKNPLDASFKNFAFKGN